MRKPTRQQIYLWRFSVLNSGGPEPIESCCFERLHVLVRPLTVVSVAVFAVNEHSSTAVASGCGNFVKNGAAIGGMDHRPDPSRSPISVKMFKIRVRQGRLHQGYLASHRADTTPFSTIHRCIPADGGTIRHRNRRSCYFPGGVTIPTTNSTDN